MILSDEHLEETLILINKAVVLNSDEQAQTNRFSLFKRIYVKLLENDGFKEIPGLFSKAFNYKNLSPQMKEYLNINKYIASYFENFNLFKIIVMKNIKIRLNISLNI